MVPSRTRARPGQAPDRAGCCAGGGLVIELVSAERCIACDKCVDVCPTNVFDRRPDGVPVLARHGDCQTCFQCEANCPADVLYVAPQASPLTADPPPGVRTPWTARACSAVTAATSAGGTGVSPARAWPSDRLSPRRGAGDRRRPPPPERHADP
ncbi:4Fe-4S dicluster domain-containing protein [Streptomyces sp. NPDC047028]|uniref:4Fe-4S dicluster domain-containing protein n=1 Tax=Streptomyces sp. NPDC047028 TaxID=3155793 RepID=UPI0033CB857C